MNADWRLRTSWPHEEWELSLRFATAAVDEPLPNDTTPRHEVTISGCRPTLHQDWTVKNIASFNDSEGTN